MTPRSNRPDRGNVAVPAADPVHREAVREHFDARYYLAANPDVCAAGMDPLDHFLLHGWREGRDPSRCFDVAYYLATNPDVAAHGISPLLHYAWVGAQEGRLPRRPLDTARRHLEASLAARTKATHWAEAADRSAPVTPAVLAAALARSAGPAGMVVSVSHDDYASNYGGIQNLIADEQQAFALAGWSYLHVSPAAPLPMLADAGPTGTFRVRLRLDGDFIGVVTFQDLLDAVAALRGARRRLDVIFHHLMGHAPELLATLASAAGGQPILWAHDFFTLCPSYALMRNDVKFCGAPPAGSAACTVCVFGPDRQAHLPRMRMFFEATRPLVLAPSAVALAFWLRQGNLPHAGSEVVPLARLVMAEGERSAALADNAAPLRVAHIGARVLHKGWPVFEELALGLAGDPRFAFYHLGAESGMPLPGCIRGVPVRVVPEQREAMIEAVAEHRIDVVVSWSLWPETFCFAVHEALAGGAFVIARSDAGNVWPVVQATAPTQGCAVEDEAELVRLFTSGEILRRVARATRAYGAVLPSGGTASWLLRVRNGAAGLRPAGAGSRRAPRCEAEVEAVLADG